MASNTRSEHDVPNWNAAERYYPFQVVLFGTKSGLSASVLTEGAVNRANHGDDSGQNFDLDRKVSDRLSIDLDPCLVHRTGDQPSYLPMLHPRMIIDGPRVEHSNVTDEFEPAQTLDHRDIQQPVNQRSPWRSSRS